MKGRSDNQLVNKSLKGSEKAFREIIMRYNGVIYAAVRSILGNSEETGDTVQRTFIKIYRGLPHYKGKARFSTWAYTIARNEAINTVNRRRKNHLDIENFHNIATRNDTPEKAYFRKMSALRLENYLKMLDTKYRVVLELRYMAEKSYGETAEIMDIPIGTVKTYIHRAKLRLKELMCESSGNRKVKGGI